LNISLVTTASEHVKVLLHFYFEKYACWKQLCYDFSKIIALTASKMKAVILHRKLDGICIYISTWILYKRKTCLEHLKSSSLWLNINKNIKLNA